MLKGQYLATTPPYWAPYYQAACAMELCEHLDLAKRYFLIVSGVLSAKLPQALAKGEWLDKSQPLVDTQEYRQLLSEPLLKWDLQGFLDF